MATIMTTAMVMDMTANIAVGHGPWDHGATAILAAMTMAMPTLAGIVVVMALVVAIAMAMLVAMTVVVTTLPRGQSGWRF